jgi:transcriptional regulator with XRE-family HTH domain
MGARRHTPAQLASKLLSIRQTLGLSQSQIARQVGVITGAPRISEYEHGTRVPCMMTVLRYARLVRVKMEVLVDDHLELIIPERKKHNQPLT